MLRLFILSHTFVRNVIGRSSTLLMNPKNANSLRQWPKSQHSCLYDHLRYNPMRRYRRSRRLHFLQPFPKREIGCQTPRLFLLSISRPHYQPGMAMDRRRLQICMDILVTHTDLHRILSTTAMVTPLVHPWDILRYFTHLIIQCISQMDIRPIPDPLCMRKCLLHHSTATHHLLLVALRPSISTTGQ